MWASHPTKPPLVARGGVVLDDGGDKEKVD